MATTTGTASERSSGGISSGHAPSFGGSSFGGSSLAGSSLRWADRLGTFGWITKGVVYLVMGVVVLQLGTTGQTAGEEASKQGALRRLAEQPFGGLLLVVVAVGLATYAAYRLLSVFLPTTGDDDKDKAKHLFRVGSAIVYGSLAVQAWSLRAGGAGDPAGAASSGGGGPSPEQSWSASLLSSTGGRVALGLVGLVLLGIAADQVRRAVTLSFMEHMHCPSSWPSASAVERAGRYGHAARGAVAALVGAFVLVAVWQHDPQEVRGLDASLHELAGAAGGRIALVAVAVGLAAYGAYAVMAARCRRHTDG